MAPSFLRLFVLPLLFLVSASAEEQNTAHIQQVCNQVGQNADLCVKSLLSYPESRTADSHTIAGLALRYAANNGAETAAFIAAQMMDPNTATNAGLQQCLDDCSEHFINAVDQLDTSTAALDKKAYNDLNTWVSAAIADVTSCNEGCEAQVGQAAEAAALKKKADEFSDLCSIALALSKLVKEQD